MKPIIRILLACTALSVSTPVFAATDTKQCNALDTSTSYTTPLQLIQNGATGCNVTTGSSGIIYVVANGQTNCSDQEIVRLFVVPGTAPLDAGSNVLAYIAGGVMTVTSPAQYSNPQVGFQGNGFTAPFTIKTGDVQNITGSGITTTLTITSQLTSTETGNMANINDTCGYLVTGLTAGANGGCGTYSVSNGSFSIGSAGNSRDFFGLYTAPMSLTYMNAAVHQTSCNGGFRTTAITGSFTGSANTAYYVGIVMSVDSLGHFASWTNSNIAVLTR